jgi:CubicO group peptidase (beta-lactamase class C family)
MAVLHLVQTGKLSLDADVNQYLKSWKVPTNGFTEKTKITLRELLSHTAGVTVHGFPGYASDTPLPTPLTVIDQSQYGLDQPIAMESLLEPPWQNRSRLTQAVPITAMGKHKLDIQ